MRLAQLGQDLGGGAHEVTGVAVDDLELDLDPEAVLGPPA